MCSANERRYGEMVRWKGEEELLKRGPARPGEQGRARTWSLARWGQQPRTLPCARDPLLALPSAAGTERAHSKGSIREKKKTPSFCFGPRWVVAYSTWAREC